MAEPSILPGGVSRRRFLLGAAAGTAALMAPWSAGRVGAEPHDDQAEWVANHVETRLMGSDGAPVAWLQRFTRLRVLRGRPNGWLEVWVPRLGLVGQVPVTAIGPVPSPTPADLAAEKAELSGPPSLGAVGLPGRVVGGANLRLWPASQTETFLRAVGHNAPLRVLETVEGDDGEEWFRVDWLDVATSEPVGTGFVNASLVRLPRLRLSPSPDRWDIGNWMEADLKDPALLVAYEDGAPIWSTLTLKGVAAFRTPLGAHEIVRRVANETMNSETLYPPIPRNGPGGYFLKNVLWTQYFTGDGSSIHYNYWSSSWGYAGSHGCLGVPYNEARFCWDWAALGTPVRVFA